MLVLYALHIRNYAQARIVVNKFLRCDTHFILLVGMPANLVELCTAMLYIDGCMAEELLTATQAAKRMGRSKRWVYTLISQGRLKFKRVGEWYLISASSVDGFKPGPVGRPTVKKAQKSPRRATERVNGKRIAAKG